MATITILRASLKMNAEKIRKAEVEIHEFKAEASAWKLQGAQTYFIAACKDVRKHKVKLAKLVALQRSIKSEITAFFRNERITRKYQVVFGKPPIVQSSTSYEMEDMLDTLIAEKNAQAAAIAVA